MSIALQNLINKLIVISSIHLGLPDLTERFLLGCSQTFNYNRTFCDSKIGKVREVNTFYHGNQNNKLILTIIGPSAEVTSGSVLRPLNIYYSLKGFRYVCVMYIPIREMPRLLLEIPRILRSDIVIVSGVAPWISALLAVLGKLMKKKVIIDFHGFGWIEANAFGEPLIYRLLVLISEKVAFRFSYCALATSKWLSNAMKSFFSEKPCTLTIENAVPFIFEKVVNTLEKENDEKTLRKYVCEDILHLCSSECYKRKLFVAPLPYWFYSNVLASNRLSTIRDKLGKNVLIAVTGTPNAEKIDNAIFATGYLEYVKYVALVLSADGIILPYPSNAVCGGIRNKVLEAGYAGKQVISTKYGMLFVEEAKPWVHYIPLEQVLENEKLNEMEHVSGKQAVNLHLLITSNYSFNSFRRKILHFIKAIIRLYR